MPDTPVDLTELVVEYRLSRDPADITLAGLCMSPAVSYTIQYKKIDPVRSWLTDAITHCKQLTCHPPAAPLRVGAGVVPGGADVYLDRRERGKGHDTASVSTACY